MVKPPHFAEINNKQMTTTEQNILSEILSAAKATNVNVVEFTNYQSINVTSIKVKHFTNENELSLSCSTKLISHKYLYSIFNELNNIKP
jgi:hypothetical protein